jgi:sulfite exporter TauE/SafE
MSYELLGIIFLGIGQLVSIVIAVWGFREMSQNHAEIVRIQRALGGLAVQESEHIQGLLQGLGARG